MDSYRDYAALDILSATWLDAIERALSVASEQFALRIKPGDATVLEVPASADEGAAVVWIEGKPRWNEASVEYASPGGGTARNLDVWVVSTADVFGSGGGGETDLTNHAFTLVIRETGVPPVGVAVMRLVGTAHWTGTVFDTVTPTVGRPSPQTIGAASAADLAAEIAARTAAVISVTANITTTGTGNGASESVTVSVPGAAIDDPAVASAPASHRVAGVMVSAIVTAADTVVVTLLNRTGLSLAGLGPTPIKIRVFK